MNKDGKKVLGSIIIMDILILVMIIVVPIASFLGLLVFALGGDEDDTGRYEYDTERIYEIILLILPIKILNSHDSSTASPPE